MNAPAPELERLVKDILACRICRDSSRPLPHEPRPVLQPSATARILIASQAPGTRVHGSGKPFTDPSGDRLRIWLGIAAEIFYDPRRIAIVPMGFCFPGLSEQGGDLPPRGECARAWRARILAAMPQIELIIAVGSYALRWHMGDRYQSSLHDTVTAWRTGLTLSPPVFALPHPSWRNNAWLKRNRWFDTELLPVLRGQVAARL